MPVKHTLKKGGPRLQRENGISRLAGLQEIRKRSPYNFLLLSDTVDIAYACGFVSSNAMLLIGPHKNLLFTDFRYFSEASQFCAHRTDLKFIPVQNSIVDVLPAHIPSGSCVGFQSNRLTVDEFARLKKNLRKVRFSPCGEQIEELFMVKRSDELTVMGRAARIGDRAFKKLLPDIVPGITECELARRLEVYCSDLGSEKPSFDTIALFGDRTALPHGKPGTRRLRQGMFVLVDFGCTVEGFASDMTRTVVCGKATGRQRAVYQTVLRAQQRARKCARAEMTANAIDALAREVIDCAGYEEQFGHALGHGVGRRIHESPRLSSKVTAKVPAGAVVTIEPGIYLPGFGGVRIEDMVVLQPDGIILLTHSPRELLEL
jgi:Xaa-Pro aminopeptidase